jgi:hypothetical protein
MDEIISYKLCAVKVRNAKLRNYLTVIVYNLDAYSIFKPSDSSQTSPTIGDAYRRSRMHERRRKFSYIGDRRR